jgi:hypothetical protein
LKEDDMPLTSKGSEIKRAMSKEYGPAKGEEVFYASRNKGTISGVDAADRADEDLSPRALRLLIQDIEGDLEELRRAKRPHDHLVKKRARLIKQLETAEMKNDEAAPDWGTVMDSVNRLVGKMDDCSARMDAVGSFGGKGTKEFVVEVEHPNGKRDKVEVECKNEAQARSSAEKSGFKVISVKEFSGHADAAENSKYENYTSEKIRGLSLPELREICNGMAGASHTIRQIAQREIDRRRKEK